MGYFLILNYEAKLCLFYNPFITLFVLNVIKFPAKGKKEFVDIWDYGLLSTLVCEYLREFPRSQKRCWAIASTNSFGALLINTPILLKDLFLPVIPKPVSVICKNSTPARFAAILDRIVHQAHRIELSGESMRKHINKTNISLGETD